jgi:hypothetical protein
MSYLSQAMLTEDVDFGRRVRSVLTEQSDTYINDTRLDIHNFAVDLLKNAAQQTQTFLQTIAAGPGIADKVDTGNGTIDSTQVTDADLLALVQAQYPANATLFYKADGSPII